jgi:hypothetical protein
MIVASKKFGRQNSAYRHQIMKGASETERPSLYLSMSYQSSVGRFFHFIDVLIDFLHRRMQFLKNFALFPGEFFNATRLLLQLFQHDVLPL